MRKAVFFRLGLLAAFLSAGCAPPATLRGLPTQSAQQNLQIIGTVYNQASGRSGHAPASAEELKPALKRLGYSDDILVSPNDGQPYTICWGVVALKSGSHGAVPVLAYETVGSAGKKWVLNAMLAVQQLTDPELEQALRVK